MSHPILDQPQVLRVVFYPRRECGPASEAQGVRPVALQVEPGVALGGRLHAANAESPAILYYHGNGEIAADYDDIAPLYTGLGITLLVMDYRGYGTSDGRPTVSNLLADAVAVFDSVGQLFADSGLSPLRLYVMGRSLGSAAAIEVAVQAGDQLAGLIIESGFSDTFGLLARMGLRVQGLDDTHHGFGNADKLRRITLPTLVIHGQNDVLIPAADGEELYRSCAAEDKRLVLIPGAGHNDLMMFGMTEYLAAIRAFVFGGVAG